MNNTIFYDGTKILSLKDKNKKNPEIYMVVTNRSAGKTTYFNRLLVSRFKKRKEKFMLIYRYNYELDNCAEKFFKDIQTLFFQNDTMISKRASSGIYHILYLNDEECGYAISLNSADQIKKNSHLFSDTQYMIFDEFQSETNHYCADEILKFQSIHKSVARGQGKQSRYVPVYMLSNPVTLLNPYFMAFGISSRLNSKTKFMRGNGWVLEFTFNESAANAGKNSTFEQAFENDSYSAFANENVYLNDNIAFIEKIKEQGKYLCTVSYKDKLYSIKQIDSLGILYVSKSVDPTFPKILSATTEDHKANQLLFNSFDPMAIRLKHLFKTGNVRFSDLESKEMFFTIIGISLF